MSFACGMPGCSCARFSKATGSYATTFAPAFTACCISAIAGASRMSSVRGLNATPQKASVRPLSPASPKRFSIFFQKCPRWSWFTTCTAALSLQSKPLARPMPTTACVSFGKQLPP